MTLQDFCSDYGLPFSTVARHLRTVASDANIHGRVGTAEAYGLSVHLDERSGRFSYSVLDPDRLARRLARAHGVGSLALTLIAIQGAVELLQLIREDAEFRIVGNHGARVIWDDAFVLGLERVEAILDGEA